MITYISMYPILFLVGSYPVAAFGVFLLLATMLGLFVIWRIALVYDLDKEKVLDLSLIAILLGFVSARFTFVLLNLSSFNSISRVIVFNLYPGLFFWGGVVGTTLAIYFLSTRFRLNFWQIVDFSVVSLFLALSIGSIGCLMGSCHYGGQSNLSIAVFQSGVIGKRFPLQLIEIILFGVVFLHLWRSVLRFHFNGQIASKGLIILGISKMILTFFQADQTFLGSFPLDRVLAGVASVTVLFFYYHLSKKSFQQDIKSIALFLLNPNKRKFAISKFYKSCYNLEVNSRVSLQSAHKKLLKLLNVKPNPNKF